VWNAQQTWFWFVINPHRNGGTIGAAVREAEAVRAACLSIEEISVDRSLALVRRGARADAARDGGQSGCMLEESTPVGMSGARPAHPGTNRAPPDGLHRAAALELSASAGVGERVSRYRPRFR